MGRYLIAFVVIIQMILAVLPALAYDYNSSEYWDVREELREEQYAAQERMEALAEELKADSSWEWSPWLLECYYRSVVDYLYARQRHSVICQQVDYTLDSWRVTKEGRYWPKDPLSNWEPLPVQDIADDPLPGGIVMQICPVERYSDPYRSGYPRARSFEISIYAPEGIEPQRTRPRAGNRCWAVHRPEMLAMRGWFEPPYTVISDPAYDRENADEWAVRIADSRRMALDWYHTQYPELPAGLNVRLEFALMRIGSLSYLDKQLTDLEEEYSGIHPADWAAEDLETWLFNTMFIVYEAHLAMECMEYSRHSPEIDIATLYSKGYLQRVPSNIFDGNRPVRMTTPAEGFSAGDICLMMPPPYWAGARESGPQPVMSQLFIYGGDPDAVPDPVLEKRLTFHDGSYWVPNGACHTTSTYTSGYLLNSDLRKAQCDT